MKSVLIVLALVLRCSLPVFAQQAQIKSFPLSAVDLSNSPFKEAQQTDLKYILSLDPDRLLAPYLREAGLQPKANGYGNWEGTGLDGHIGGHYLSALANMYAATGNKETLRRLEYMLRWLDSCQQKNGNGYIGGVPDGKSMWQQIGKGNIKAAGFSLNDKWVPWYNLHKLYAGLVDAYTLTGNEKAKQLLVKLADWALQLVKNLSDTDMQNMLRSEHGGMNEVFANVSQITGEKKYLDLARRFSHRVILDPLIERKDVLNGMHANTQIPKVIGFMRVAALSGDTSWAGAAKFFWETVTDKRSVSIGGNSVKEHFNPVNDFSSMIQSVEGPETCNSYNMLKLTKELFFAAPVSTYIDYYERTLYNHILSSQHPNGGFVYFTPMRPRHYRVYSQREKGFWCCVGSGMENHGKYGELIYSHTEQDVFVNLFIPSSLEWKERGITLVQDTRFPFQESSKIKLQLKKPQTFGIRLRSPSWLRSAMKVSVNKKPVAVSVDESGYATIRRTWRSGDIISITLPMQTRAEYLPDGSSWVSFIHGPVVLAAVTDSTDLTGIKADSSRMGHVANGPLYPIGEAPSIVTESKELAAALKPVKNQPMHFTVSELIEPGRYKHLKLVPFYQVHDARYMIYWPVVTPEQFAERQRALNLNNK